MARRPCPICGQDMDFCSISFRNHPFIDGKTYKRMCFACANVPEDFVQTYDEKGNIATEEGPFFDWKHIRSPEELVHIGSAASLVEAKRCVKAVKRALKEVGAKELNKLKLTRPKPEYIDVSEGDRDYEDDEEPPKKAARRKRADFARKVQEKTQEEPEEIPRRKPKKRLMVQEVVVKKFTASKKPK